MDDQSHVVGSGQGLHDQKLIEMKEKEINLVMLGPEGFNALEEQLIEKRLVDWVIDKHEKGEDSRIKQLKCSNLTSKESGISIGIIKKRWN